MRKGLEGKNEAGLHAIRILEHNSCKIELKMLKIDIEPAGLNSTADILALNKSAERY
jgi:hypothetical protein